MDYEFDIESLIQNGIRNRLSLSEIKQKFNKMFKKIKENETRPKFQKKKQKQRLTPAIWISDSSDTE